AGATRPARERLRDVGASRPHVEHGDLAIAGSGGDEPFDVGQGGAAAAEERVEPRDVGEALGEVHESRRPGGHLDRVLGSWQRWEQTHPTSGCRPLVGGGAAWAGPGGRAPSRARSSDARSWAEDTLAFLPCPPVAG